MDAHDHAVQQISSQVRKFYAAKTPFRIYHGSTLSTRTSSRQKNAIVDTSSLSHVLSFDHATKRALVEPNVSMDALVAATAAEGLLPQVVMELPNITVGGGFAGTSGESSSFRYGLFDRTVTKIEVVLGNGEVVWASAEDPETRDLFFGCAGSCGSLGIVTALEMQLIPAKKFVELTYIPVGSTGEAIDVLKTAEKDSEVDYMDGILFSMASGVIMTGRLTDTPIANQKIQTFDKAFDPWFYIHAQEILEKMRKNGGKSHTETIPVASYLFRYDRGVFWGGMHAFKYFVTPFNALTRWLLDPYMNSRTMIHALHRSGLASQTLIQDLAVPYNTAEEFIRWTDARTGIWPLWLCPVRPAPAGEKSFSMGKNINEKDMLLDVGIWGMGPKDAYEFIRLNRDFEKKTAECEGLKCLYAHAYYTEEEFWGVYDEQGYRGLRMKYHAENIPSVYEKVRVNLKGVAGGEESVKGRETWAEWSRRQFWDVWPLGGLYGVASATKGLLVTSDFLLKK